MCSPGLAIALDTTGLRYRELLGRFCHAACFGDGKEDIQLLDALAFHPGTSQKIARSGFFSRATWRSPEL